MKSYTYYSDGGYRFFYIDGSELKEITTEEYYDLPPSVIYYCSHYGLKLVYRVLPETQLMLSVLNIPGKATDDSGRKIPFSMVFIGRRADIETMNKLAVIVADNLAQFESFVSELFQYDTEGNLFFDSLKLDELIKNIERLPFPNTGNRLSNVSKDNQLLIYEGTSLESSLRDFEGKFTREQLGKAIIYSKNEALAYQGVLDIPFNRLIPDSDAGPDTGEPGKSSSLQELAREMEDRNREQALRIQKQGEELSISNGRVSALKEVLSDKDSLIKKLKFWIFLFSGGAFLLGLIIGLLIDQK